MDQYISKFKDARPIDTIERIRGIYKELNILPRETSWKNSLDSFYSVSLEIEEGVRTNGKGTTKEYALASAYAESLERIQNLAPFRLTMDFSPEIFEYMGFFYSPDEKCFTTEELLDSNEDWINLWMDELRNNKELINLWKDISYEHIPCDFIAQPFINLMSKQTSHIPVKMLSKLYMSNGMCAGNSPEEAIVQGISEIFERYVNKEILLNDVIPPTIPIEQLDANNIVVDMIESIENNGRYKIILKDCSLGIGLPVIGIVIIDRINQSYFIKFGCHPNLYITIERTLTELLQGQDINSLMGLKEFCIYPTDINFHKNMVGILINGSGYYPYDFFKHKGSYPLTDLSHFTSTSNKAMLNKLIELIGNLGYEIYIRDVSFLGFPTYHVVIPGLSEVETIDSSKELKEYTLYNKVKEHIRDNDINKEDLDTITTFYDNNVTNPYISIPSLLNINLATPLPWYYINITLYLAAQHYKFENYKKAYELLDDYISRSISFKSESNLPYFKCARDFIGCLNEELDYLTTTKLLSNFYDINVINCVYKDFIPSENILSNYGKLCCWDCDNCSFNINCLNKKTIALYKKLKEKYASIDIFQKDLLLLLNIKK